VGKTAGQQGLEGEASPSRFIHKAVVSEEAGHPLKLLDFVMTAFAGVKRTQAKQWLAYKSLLVNDEVQIRYDHPLRTGDVVTVRAGKTSATALSPGPHSLQGVNILFEDDVLIAVDKPHGMLTAPLLDNAAATTATTTATARTGSSLKTNNLQQLVNAFLGKKKQKAFVVHRLDEEMGGVVVFAKTLEAKEQLQKNWDSFGRIFICVCQGSFTPLQGSIKSHQLENDPQRVQSYFKAADAVSSSSGVKSPLHVASTNYRTLALSGLVSLVEASLVTNRKDQIRSQFALLNHAICGERKYNVSSNNSAMVVEDASRLAIYASEVRLVHPSTNEALTIPCTTPLFFNTLLKQGKSTSSSGSYSTLSVVAPPYMDDEIDENEEEEIAFPLKKEVSVVSLEEWLGKPVPVSPRSRSTRRK